MSRSTVGVRIDTPQIQEFAMAERNEQLRHARKRLPPAHPRRMPGPGELAELANEWIYRNRSQITNLDRNYVGKLERAVVHWPDEVYRAALRVILDADNDPQLGFYDNRRIPAGTTTADRRQFLQAAARERVGAPRGVGWPTMVAHAADPQGIDTNRRQLLSSTLGLLGAAAPAITALGEQPIVRATAVDPAIAEHFTALRAVLVDSESGLGAGWVLLTVGQQLAVIAELRRNVAGRLHDQVLATESRWAEFAGWLTDDLGDAAAGERWLSRSLVLARRSPPCNAPTVTPWSGRPASSRRPWTRTGPGGPAAAAARRSGLVLYHPVRPGPGSRGVAAAGPATTAARRFDQALGMWPGIAVITASAAGNPTLRSLSRKESAA